MTTTLDTPSTTTVDLKPRRRRPSRGRILTYIVLSVGFVATILPFVWMLLGSVKTQGELSQRPITWWPETFTLNNFARWFTELDFLHYFMNSLIIAVCVVLGNLVFCSMVGWTLAKLDFPGKRLLFGMVLAMLMVPGVVTLIPTFVLVANLGLVDTYGGLILPFLAGPIGVFLMRQFMLEFPDSLIEAVRIDGAGEFRIFFTIVLPLCRPPLATLAILTFLGSWNNFLWPLIVAQSNDMYTLPVALSLFSIGPHSTDYGVLLAGSVLIIAPILILFILMQRHFIQGIAMTGIK